MRAKDFPQNIPHTYQWSLRGWLHSVFSDLYIIFTSIKSASFGLDVPKFEVKVAMAV